jgi:hypothetical protein
VKPHSRRTLKTLFCICGKQQNRLCRDALV